MQIRTAVRKLHRSAWQEDIVAEVGEFRRKLLGWRVLSR